MLISTFKKICVHPNLKTLLVVPFVLQIITGIGIVSYLSYFNSQKAIEELTLELRHEIAIKIEEYVDNYLAISSQINQINQDIIILNELDINNLEKLGRYFAYEYRWTDAINLVAFGNEKNGSYVEVLKDKNNLLKLTIIDTEKEGSLLSYKINNKGEILELINTQKNHDYDPRKRPWYQKAIKSNKTQTSSLYKTKLDQQLVVATSKLLYDNNGDLLGVLTNNINLSELSTFVGNLRVGKTGMAFILNTEGLLIADPTNDQELFHPAIESGNYYIKKIAEYLLLEQKANVDNNYLKEYKIELQNNNILVEFLPYKNNLGIDWLIVIVIPESDFMELINHNHRITIILSLLTLIIVIISSLITSNLIIKPIIKLKNASQEIAQGELNQTITPPNIQELDTLAQTFNQIRSN